MPLATPLPQLKRELEDLLLDLQYLATALQRLRDLLPEQSEKRVTVVTLLGRLNDANKKALRQVLDDHALQIEYNSIRSDLLDLIAGLDPADFQENAKTEPPLPNAAGKQGSVLYRIPHAMPLHKETECVVRIAVSEDAIVEDITIDKQVIVKGLSRISDLMQVELTDPARNPVFNIRSTSTPQQLITGEGYTQWFFYVEPLQEGVHALEVKVCVLEMALNQIARKELVFRETIEIYTEGKTGGTTPGSETSAPTFKKAGEALAFQGPGSTNEPASKSATVVEPDFQAEILNPPPAPPAASAPQTEHYEPAEKTSGRGMRAVAFALAFLVLGSTTTWALTPPETRDWWVASIQDSPEAYSRYITRYGQKHPKSPYVEKAFYYKAVRTQQLADFRAYETRYPGSTFSRQVASQLNTLEINEIHSIKQHPTVENIRRFAADFPNSERLSELKAAAETNPDRREQLMAAVEDAYVSSTKLKPTAQKIENYLHDFPNASRLDEIHAAAASNPQVFAKVQPQLEDAFLKKMETNPTRAEAEDFLNKFPEPVQKKKFERILDKKPAVKRSVIRKMRKMEAAKPPATNPKPADTSNNSTKAPLDTNPQAPVREEPPATDPSPPAKPRYIEPDMVRIPAGSFQMGSNDGGSYERPVHPVNIRAFQLAKTEVTFEEYDLFCEATGRDKPNDWGWGRGRRPVINVSWNDAKAYCAWLSQMSGKRYRLPTEAEWEYAARGGGQSGYKYAGSNDIGAVAWYEDNSGGQTHPVGGKRANALGLYDMSGNVYEWCEDWYHDTYDGAPYDGSAWLSPAGSSRVCRGGSWLSDPQGCRVANRYDATPDYRSPYIGFRLARTR